jgi:uncharacterized membrane protein
MIVLWVMGLAMVLAHGQMPHLILKLVLVVLLSGIRNVIRNFTSACWRNHEGAGDGATRHDHRHCGRGGHHFAGCF